MPKKVILIFFFFACSAYAIAQTPVPVIFDTDIGPDYDDVGAITLLHAFADSGKAKILATIASNKYEGIAAVLNLFNTYFLRPEIPIGVPHGYAVDQRDSQHWTDSLLSKYPHTIRRNSEVPDAVELYRKILASQPDHSVVVITVGFLTNLSNLLRSGPDNYSRLNGQALVRQKVKGLVSMAGSFPKGKEFNVFKDTDASIYVFTHWPVPVLFSGFEIGKKIKCGLPLIHNEMIQNSPVKDAFRICIPLAAEDSAGRSSWDETAVLVGVTGYAPYYKTRRGRIQVAADGSNTWLDAAAGKEQAYLVEDKPAVTVQDLIDGLMKHQPVGHTNPTTTTGPSVTAPGQVSAVAQHAGVKAIIDSFVRQQVSVRSISQVVLSPDGQFIAWNADGPDGSQVIYRAPLAHPEKSIRVTAATEKEWCNESEPQWSPDGLTIAFLSDYTTRGQAQVFIAGAAAAQATGPVGVPAAPRQLTHFNGHVSHLHWSPDGKYLSVLYVDKASREPSPMAAENKAVGVIDSLVNHDIQSIVLIRPATGETRQFSPGGLYIFEYAWRPDSKGLAFTAAAPPGDDNWYMAQLYRQDLSDTNALCVYQPAWQIALPRWSPDGKRISFIEGLMSDQGGTGGEIFTIAATGNEKPQNLTPGRHATPAWYTWQPDGTILFTEFAGGVTNICSLNTSSGAIRQLWQEERSIQAACEERSFSISGNKDSPLIAFVRMGWAELPEVWAGNFHEQVRITHLNESISLPMPKAVSIEWENEGRYIQGWLLYPAHYNPSRHYPLLVNVHGGPAWIATPAWSLPDFNATVYTQLGYFVFLPNARGSYGQGEKFAQANRRDWGHGDLRDMLAGVDSIVKSFPIDNDRIGMMGWSYGGYMSMFAVTQTRRFKAVVAGAGAGDWLSYYGQNSIDKWMKAYFGTSPYDDPAAFARVSAMTYIKQVKTPALILVGELDGEAPPAQSLQFWHALKELGVPTQLVIYPDEGHSFYKLEDTVDVTLRTIEWFNRYLGTPAE